MEGRGVNSGSAVDFLVCTLFVNRSKISGNIE